jgi:hypothetical protein
VTGVLGGVKTDQVLIAIRILLRDEPTFVSGRWVAPKALYREDLPIELAASAGWLMRWLDEHAKEGT